ncbi:glucosamine 6-phosphate N-acetyltransferase isoform X2 [Colletes latitarsis]|uniref:glucosamine 6-phosphate N-acetyltransferase isoform X2 n=1 Tax=Colletes latitarsis TaxID=2605962 RepID=UPI0040369F27
MSSVEGNNFGDTETELFNASILERLSLSQVEGLLIRPLQSGDYDRDFLQLLTQLTEVGNISKEQFLKDVSTGKIIASATLVVEQKFIHNCALRGRLEDVVVNNKYRGKQLGKLVVKIILQLAHYLQCYKLSLDCKDSLITFYESLGFKREPSNANYLNMRFHNENTTEQSHL